MRTLKNALKLLAFVTVLIIPGLAGAGEYNLTIDEMPFSPSGKQRTAIAVNGSVPGPTLRWQEGEEVTIRVTNNLKVDASIHWHGLLVPSDMDGVPGVSFEGIKPGETFIYTFTVNQYGTYWYHSHSALQEQAGVYGALIIDPKPGDPYGYDREHTILLSDWTDEKPKKVLANLKKRSDYYNYNKRTVGDFFRDVKANGLGGTVKERMAWGKMRMDPTDISDISGYIFLMNGQAPGENWWGEARSGEKVRLRIINGSAMSFFDFTIPGLKMTVVQADGQNIQPILVDEIRLAAAETYDVIVEIPDDRAYTIYAEAMDRTGYARGTLSPNPGMSAPIPEMRPRTVRTMADMPGMAIMDSMENMAEMDTAQPMIADMDMAYKVLSYSDLKSLEDFSDKRPPEREVIIRLTGNMERYIWTINGVRFQDADPIHMRLGERVRLTFINETMMDHPMHLHGMWMELLDAMGVPAARKHTISIAPANTISVDITADALGTWAFHCHLLYHMKTGMFTTVVVTEAGEGGYE